MKIKIELDETLTEKEVIIKCNYLDETVQTLQKLLLDSSLYNIKLEFF